MSKETLRAGLEWDLTSQFFELNIKNYGVRVSKLLDFLKDMPEGSFFIVLREEREPPRTLLDEKKEI